MLAKLTAVLVAYGLPGILVLAFIDSAGIPVASGMDALVILVAAKTPSHALAAAVDGSAGIADRKRSALHGRPNRRAALRKGRTAARRQAALPRVVPALRLADRLHTVYAADPAALEGIRDLCRGVRHAAANVCGGGPAGRAIRYGGEAYLGVVLGEGSWRYLRAHTWHLLGGAVALFAVLYLLLIVDGAPAVKTPSLRTPQSRMNCYSSPRSNGFFVY